MANIGDIGDGLGRRTPEPWLGDTISGFPERGSRCPRIRIGRSSPTFPTYYAARLLSSSVLRAPGVLPSCLLCPATMASPMKSCPSWSCANTVCDQLVQRQVVPESVLAATYMACSALSPLSLRFQLRPLSGLAPHFPAAGPLSPPCNSMPTFIGIRPQIWCT